MSGKKRINLALQGGGAHGAFTWGVLDRLLEEDRIEIDGITATSAGAMNAAALKCGWVRGGNAEARKCLDDFWGKISCMAQQLNPVAHWMQFWLPETTDAIKMLSANPAYVAGEMVTRVLSPYDFNPLDYNPLREILHKELDFDNVCADYGPQLFICATNVRSGKIKVFQNDEVGVEAVLASACLPTLFRAIEIEDPQTGQLEAYWDGGYSGNPALYPLFYETQTRDVMIVHINPIERHDVPENAGDILNRINEISFNSSLLRELRNVEFVQRLLRDGLLPEGKMRDVLVHSIRDDETMRSLSVATKVQADSAVLDRLKAAGRQTMDRFLTDHWADIGVRDTVDLRAMFG